jgi:hypothetical protein
MEPRRGLMIQAPMGTGKSFYVTEHNKSYVVDGDELLELYKIKNRNYFWYHGKYESERNAIIEVFDNFINHGYWIFYSGNPQYLLSDIIILPDEKIRWEQLQQRNGFKPTQKHFDMEQKCYEEACHDTKFYIHGKIPSLTLLAAMHQEILDD